MTKVNPHLFDFLRKSTNATEQTHHKSNMRGISLSLLVAIERCVSSRYLPDVC